MRPRIRMETEIFSGIDVPLQAQQALMSTPRGEKERSARLVEQPLWGLSSPDFKTGGMSNCSNERQQDCLQESV